MKRTFAAYGLAFLAGAGFTWGAFEIFGPTKNPAPRGSESAPGSQLSSTSGEIPSVTSSTSSIAESSPSERARRIVEEMWPAIRTSEPRDRAARMQVLLARLRSEGESGWEAIAGLLATGEDFPLARLVISPRLGWNTAPTARLAMISALQHSNNPAALAAAEHERVRTLHSAKTLAEVDYAINRSPSDEVRQEAVAAVLRISASENPAPAAVEPADSSDYSNDAAMVLKRLGAPELLPAAEKSALKKPKAALTPYLEALWKVPANLRAEATSRLCSDLEVCTAVADAPPLAALDLRLTPAREFALNFFSSSLPGSQKAALLGSLAYGQRVSDFSMEGVELDPAAGTPGTPAQAQARLSLLEEISPLCPEPFIQQKIAETRLLLQKQLAGEH